MRAHVRQPKYAMSDSKKREEAETSRNKREQAPLDAATPQARRRRVRQRRGAMPASGAAAAFSLATTVRAATSPATTARRRHNGRHLPDNAGSKPVRPGTPSRSATR